LVKQLKEEHEKQEMPKDKPEESKEKSSKKWYNFLLKKSASEKHKTRIRTTLLVTAYTHSCTH